MESNLNESPSTNLTLNGQQSSSNHQQGPVSLPGINPKIKTMQQPLDNVREQVLNNIRFKPHNGNQFYKPQTPQAIRRVSATQQSRVSVLKVYEHNGHFESKLPERLTFGPHDFPKDLILNKPLTSQNPQEILPITHKKSTKSKSIVRLNNLQQGSKKSKVYDIMRKELGISDQKLESLKPDTINHELEKFVKRKGLEYLQENHENIKRSNTEGSHPLKYEGEKLNSERKQNKRQVEGRPKYVNYLPEVFPKINRKSSSRKTIFSQKDRNSRQKELPKKQTKKQMKLMALNDYQQMLGKIVYDKVQDYFKLDQKKADYFSRVKSQEKIDTALVEYLKTKIDRADLILKEK